MLGAQLRDEHVWKYPLLPAGLYTYSQMVSGREFKVSGKPRAVSRGVEFLNKSEVRLQDGTVETGLENVEKRRSMDHNCVGRTMYAWDIGKPLEYLDPTVMYFQLETREWINSYTEEKYPVDRVVVNHPIPVGVHGNFVSPISFVVPTAMMAWLIREHDRAAADGRKIRDIMVVGSESLLESMKQAIVDMIAIWTGAANPASSGVPVVSVDILPGQKVEDLIARVGLANIPENFQREQFQFQYVNEIAGALGLALRYIWNSEKATNRALEEVQEARQAYRGPASFVKSEQRMFNRCGMLNQFGSSTRFGFVEEIDIASQEINAKVLKLYAEAAKIFKESGIVLDDKALIAWLQSADILPADLEIIASTSSTNPDALPTPSGSTTEQTSDALRSSRKKKAVKKAVYEAVKENEQLDYDEISMDSNGNVIERRTRVFSIEKALVKQMREEAQDERKVLKRYDQEKTINFDSALKIARLREMAEFRALLGDPSYVPDENARTVLEHIEKKSVIDSDFRLIRNIIEAYKSNDSQNETEAV